MRNHTKLLSIFLAMFILISIVQLTVSATEIVASDTCEDDNVTWQLDSEGVLTFIGTGEIGSFETFAVIKETEFSGIINFKILEQIKSIYIPDSITDIHYQAFQECNNLEKITVDENNAYYSSVDGVMFNKDMTILEKYPSADSRTHYTVPATVQHIGSHAFMTAKNLKTIDLPVTLKTINSFSFFECSFETVVIPENVTSISGSAFKWSDSLTEISIPASVKDLSAEFAFGCSALKNINISPDNEYYSSENGVMFNKDKTTLMHYPAGRADRHYVIPETVTYIEEFAFDMAENLRSIVIHESLVKTGDNSFRGTYLRHIGYTGSMDMWENIDFGKDDMFNINIQIEKYNTVLHCNFNSDKDLKIDEKEYYSTYKCSCGLDLIITEKECSHICHKSGLIGFFWKIINFFSKLFGVNPVCECGMAHY